MTIYFYKVNDPYGCFSNFSLHNIYLCGCKWLTVEHFYQSQKFVGTPNEFLIDKIRSVPTPEEAAFLGRDRTRQVRQDWEQVKNHVMHKAVTTKFLSHTQIQSILLSTGDQMIVEDSPRDYYWGCGLDKSGRNQLGQILMSVRQEIRDRLR